MKSEPVFNQKCSLRTVCFMLVVFVFGSAHPAGSASADQSCSDVLGRVFDDKNRNGYQDKGEVGLAGVRLVTPAGLLVRTDKNGRFHIACNDVEGTRVGANHSLKLDQRTLPTGYRMTTENPRVVRATPDKSIQMNFGASLGRVVRLDLSEAAFLPEGMALRAKWQERLEQLMAILSKEQSVLVIAYTGKTIERAIAQERVERLRKTIAQKWRENSGRYRLEIETRVHLDG